MPYEQWVAQIKEVQDAYNVAKAAGDVAGMKRALSRVDEAQTFWWGGVAGGGAG